MLSRRAYRHYSESNFNRLLFIFHLLQDRCRRTMPIPMLFGTLLLRLLSICYLEKKKSYDFTFQSFVDWNFCFFFAFRLDSDSVFRIVEWTCTEKCNFSCWKLALTSTYANVSAFIILYKFKRTGNKSHTL